ncbi:DUF7009 family protein [Aquisphaera insulae]|uniref:DUF7009 family protein n=1 Tax=Aquisphaera insulae TaxID=2712864 RepID=UPI0013E9CFA6|nr:hypothetical protein [Aquisphaera insulae]
MKLRIKGNSIRIRLDRRDLKALVEQGRVDDALRFGPDLAFTYAVAIGPAPRERPRASYEDGRLVIRILAEDAAGWLAGDRVGFDHRQDVDGGTIRVLIEKDFACIDRPAGEADDDAFAFPNPSLSC